MVLVVEENAPVVEDNIPVVDENDFVVEENMTAPTAPAVVILANSRAATEGRPYKVMEKFED